MSQNKGIATATNGSNNIVGNAADAWMLPAKTLFDLGFPVALVIDGVAGAPTYDVAAMSYNSGTNKYTATIVGTYGAATTTANFVLATDFVGLMAMLNPGDTQQQSLLNRNFKKLASAAVLSFTPTQQGWNTVVYISAATGRTGTHTGAPWDPLDCSTAVKFDTVMDSLGTYTEVRAPHGALFLTNGVKWNDDSKGWTVKTGLRLVGKWTIKLATYPNFWNSSADKHTVVGSRYYESEVHDIFIEDITIDCNWGTTGGTINWTGTTNKAVIPCFIYGSNNTLHRVTQKNNYGDVTSGTEGFGLCLSAHPSADGSGNQIIECVAINPHGDYSDGPAVFGFTDGTSHTIHDGGCITGCTIIGDFRPAACGTAFSSNLLVDRNWSFGTQKGFYNDTGTVSGLILTNNRFMACQIVGIDFNGPDSLDGFSCRGNVVQAPSFGIRCAADVMSNLIIEHNQVLGTTSLTTSCGIFIGVAATNVRIVDNQRITAFEAGLSISRDAIGVKVFNNVVDTCVVAFAPQNTGSGAGSDWEVACNTFAATYGCVSWSGTGAFAPTIFRNNKLLGAPGVFGFDLNGRVGHLLEGNIFNLAVADCILLPTGCVCKNNKTSLVKVADGVTNSTATVTSATAAFTSFDLHQRITGAGIPANTFVGIINSGTSIGLSSSPTANTPVNATATATGVALTLGGRYVEATGSTAY